MASQWRRFEKLIARIERAMAPSGAVVKSPDRIPDKVTGELREVDASIRYKVGTSPVLITLECRDRVCVQDVQWIEQLAEKQKSTGAAITVAVSSSGFTGPAIKKAEALGIRVRTLTDASADDFIQWLKVQSVDLDVKEWAMAGLALELYDVPQDAELAPALQQSLREQGSRALIFIRNADGKRFDVENFLIEWNKRMGTFFPSDLPADGTKIRRTSHQRLERGSFRVETTRGDFDVRVIHIELSLSRRESQSPVARLSEYSDAQSVLVQTAAWSVPENVRLSLHRDMTSGGTKVQLTPDEPTNGQ